MKKEVGKGSKQQSRVVTMVRGGLDTKARGELGELAFALKAASLGFGVSKPHGDDEQYDYIVDSGRRLWRVQIKSCCRPYNTTGYRAHGDRGARTVYKTSEIDFLVAYIVPLDVWYVIPVRQITANIVLYPLGCTRKGGYFECFREAWRLMGARPSAPSA